MNKRMCLYRSSTACSTFEFARKIDAMTPTSLLSRLLTVTLALQTCMAATYVTLPSVMLNGTSPPTSRRLPSTSKADKECTINGQRIHGFQYLNGYAPFRIGSYLAMCDESLEDHPRLTCFVDDGVQDSKRPMHVADCTEVAKKAKSRKASSLKARELGVFHQSIFEQQALWPGGVICYTLARKWVRGSTTQVDTTHEAKLQAFFTKDVKFVFDKYHEKTGNKITFMDINECEESKRVCGGCKHAVMISTPNDHSCVSSVGFQWPLPDDLLNSEDQAELKAMYRDQAKVSEMSFQSLTLGAAKYEDGASCQDRAAIFHEVGHTLGLHHDHQHPDSRNRVLLNLEKIDPENAVRRLPIVRRQIAGATAATSSQVLEALHAEEKKLVATKGRLMTNYAVLNFLSGKYNIKSIMHYSHVEDVCLLRKSAQPGATVSQFCDVEQTGTCFKGTTAHCNTAASKAKWKHQVDGATPGDFKTVENLYSFRPDAGAQASTEQVATIGAVDHDESDVEEEIDEAQAAIAALGISDGEGEVGTDEDLDEDATFYF